MAEQAYLIWGLALIGACVLLTLVEVFVPSMGLISLVALLVGVAGVGCLFSVSTAWGIAGLLVLVVLIPMTIAFGVKTMPSTYFGRRLLYGDEGEDHPVLAGTDQQPFAHLVGQTGTAVGDLRPVGIARFGEEKVEVLSEVALVRAGTPVVVTSAEGMQVKVRPVDGSGSGSRDPGLG